MSYNTLVSTINKEDIEKMWDIKFTDKQWLKFVKEKQDQFADNCIDMMRDSREYYINSDDEEDDEDEKVYKCSDCDSWVKSTESCCGEEIEEDDEDDEDDGLEVSEIIIKEKVYLLSDNGDIYNPDTSKIVGKSENGIHTLFKMKFKIKSKIEQLKKAIDFDKERLKNLEEEDDK